MQKSHMLLPECINDAERLEWETKLAQTDPGKKFEFKNEWYLVHIKANDSGRYATKILGNVAEAA